MVVVGRVVMAMTIMMVLDVVVVADGLRCGIYQVIWLLVGRVVMAMAIWMVMMMVLVEVVVVVVASKGSGVVAVTVVVEVLVMVMMVVVVDDSSMNAPVVKTSVMSKPATCYALIV